MEGYSNRSVCLSVCLSVISYAQKKLRFTCEAIRQWKEHLLFCRFYVGIVVKPFRFREKGCEKQFS